MANLRLDWGDDAPVKDIDPTKITGRRNPGDDKPPKAKGVMGPAGLAKAMVNSANAKVGYALATLSAQSSCPDGKNTSYRCPLYNNGCYAEDPAGGKTIFTTKLLNEAAGLDNHNSGSNTATPEEVATDEAAAIIAAIPVWKKLRINNWVRLHVVGDAVTAECARIISKAAEQLSEPSAVNTKNIWNYTHAWRQVPRSAWSSKISVLASCDRIEDLPKAHDKGYATAIVMPKQLMKEMGAEQNKDFGKSFMLPNGFSAVPCPYEIGNIVKVKAKQCVECKLCMKENWLRSSKSVIVFAAHTPKSEAEAKKLIDITIDDVSAKDTGVPVSENPVHRKASVREYTQPAYDETKPTTRDAYNAGLEAGAEDRHVPATKAEELERVQSQAWQFLQGHRLGMSEGNKLAAQFAIGYREGMSGKYQATANPVHLSDAQGMVLVHSTPWKDDKDSVLSHLSTLQPMAEWHEEPHHSGFWLIYVPAHLANEARERINAYRDMYRDLHPRRGTTAQRLNPHLPDEGQEASADAAAMYREFHGRDSHETLRYVEEDRYEDNLAVLGEMVELKIATLTRKDVVIDFTGCRVVLACNESGDQLYLVGGDQSLDLKAMAFTGDKANKTTVALGTAYELTYRTEKGFDKFKLTDYYHEIGEETGFQPIATYNTLNQTIEIVGGEYKVKPEGIVN